MAGGGLIWLWQGDETPVVEVEGPWIESRHERAMTEEYLRIIEERRKKPLSPLPQTIKIDPLIDALPEATSEDTLLLLMLLDEL